MRIMEQKFLKKLAQKIDNEFENEYAELSEIGKDFSPALDAKLLETAKSYDKKYSTVQKARKDIQFLKKIAIFLVVFLSANAIAIGTSQAYRQFVFQVLENKDNNAITFHNRAEQDMLGSWDDYWYPTYLPKNYQIVAAEENPEKSILIHAGESSLLITEYSKGAEISYDTKHSQLSDIRIHNSIGKKMVFDEQNIIVYPTDTYILEFTFDSEISEEEVVKIAENMEYVNLS